jgi:hypothetical protein
MGEGLEIPLALMSLRRLTIGGSLVGTLDELKALMQFASAGRLPPIAVETRPMSEINNILDDLQARRSFNSGGEEEDRTPDLCIANAALSQLSYPPTVQKLF